MGVCSCCLLFANRKTKLKDIVKQVKNKKGKRPSEAAISRAAATFMQEKGEHFFRYYLACLGVGLLSPQLVN